MKTEASNKAVLNASKPPVEGVPMQAVEEWQFSGDASKGKPPITIKGTFPEAVDQYNKYIAS